MTGNDKYVKQLFELNYNIDVHTIKPKTFGFFGNLGNLQGGAFTYGCPELQGKDGISYYGKLMAYFQLNFMELKSNIEAYKNNSSLDCMVELTCEGSFFHIKNEYRNSNDLVKNKRLINPVYYNINETVLIEFDDILFQRGQIAVFTEQRCYEQSAGMNLIFQGFELVHDIIES